MMKEIEENRYKYIGIVELDIVKSQKMGEQECKRKLKLVLKSKLNGKNKIKTWAVAVLSDEACIIKWTESCITHKCNNRPQM